MCLWAGCGFPYHEDAATGYYRYTGFNEKSWVDQELMVESKSGITFLSPDVFESAEEAWRRLALPKIPAFRIGPFYPHELPAIVIPDRVVSPNFGQPGGGRECAVEGPIRVFGVKRLL